MSSWAFLFCSLGGIFTRIYGRSEPVGKELDAGDMRTTTGI